MTTAVLELIALVVVLCLMGPKLEALVARLEQRLTLHRRSRRPARLIDRVAPRPADAFARAAGLSRPLPPVLPPAVARPHRYLAVAPHKDPFGRVTSEYLYPTVDALLADCGYPAEELRRSCA